jgi:GDPmannose 4,6-dehydratase
MSKSALITGITGQDGRYLAQHLNKMGYSVYGLVSGQNNPRAYWIKQNMSYVQLIEGDMRDVYSLIRALQISEPQEVYNLAAVSHVGISWKQPELVSEVSGLGVLRMLEAIKIYTSGNMSKIRFYQASTSEMFGNSTQIPQNENTPFRPRSPYGVAKLFGHSIAVNYRESYGAFASCGILFNHESPLRGTEFVTRKITRNVADIYHGKTSKFFLGNLESRRDWGFAGDYVKAMHLMLQQDNPDDYVIATGETHSIREFLDLAFSFVGISDWSEHVSRDPLLERPAEVDLLIGDSSKAKKILGWEAETKFADLVKMMVDSDLKGQNP